MTVTRRAWLQRMGQVGSGAVGVAALSACGGATDDETTGTSETDGGDGDGLPHYEYDGELGPETIFEHGVASGDPLVDAVIVWTRISVEPEAEREAFLEVALSPDFETRVAADYVPAPDPSSDDTVKVDVTDLEPGTTYYFRFHSLGRTSPIGRTRTAPSGAVDRVRLGVCACASYAHGFFHGYRGLARRKDLDAIVHLGDYIYEYASGQYGSRREYDPPTEIITLDDYRRRYRQYRRDADLQECHRQHPFIVIWDDHEVADNSWSAGAGNHNIGEGDFGARKAAARQAFLEWIPIREQPNGQIYRVHAYGDLADLILIDTRHEARDREGSSPLEYEDPDRRLISDEQAAWIEAQLDGPAQWKILCNQVMMAQLRLGTSVLNADQWDGYVAQRDRLWSHVRANVDNFVVLTGDIHTSWANDLVEDPDDPVFYDPATGDGALGVEFVCTSITSPGLVSNDAVEIVRASNPHMQFIDMEAKGYLVLDITPERVQSDFMRVANVGQMGFGESDLASWEVLDGAPSVHEASGPATPNDDAPELAP